MQGNIAKASEEAVQEKVVRHSDRASADIPDRRMRENPIGVPQVSLSFFTLFLLSSALLPYASSLSLPGGAVVSQLCWSRAFPYPSSQEARPSFSRGLCKRCGISPGKIWLHLRLSDV
jgi:hypothetical protein